MAHVQEKENLGVTEAATATGANSSPASAGASARKPYHAPRLRYLGSVRELTGTGAGASIQDLSNFKTNP